MSDQGRNRTVQNFPQDTMKILAPGGRYTVSAPIPAPQPPLLVSSGPAHTNENWLCRSTEKSCCLRQQNQEKLLSNVWGLPTAQKGKKLRKEKPKPTWRILKNYPNT